MRGYDLIEIEIIDTIKSGTISCGEKAREARGNMGERQILCGAKTSHWLLYRCANASGRLAKLNGAHSSIIDGNFYHMKRTKVIQIAVTLQRKSGSTGKFPRYLSIILYI